MIKQEDVYKIGKIGKPHGVKGELTLFFDDDVFDRVDAQYLVLDIDGILVPFFIDERRYKTADTALVKFSGVDSKEGASELTGSAVYFPKLLSDRDEDELTWDEINGFEIIDTARGNLPVGKVVGVDDATENVLLEVETPKGDIILIPACEEIVASVSAADRRIEAALPDGLIDLNDN